MSLAQQTTPLLVLSFLLFVCNTLGQSIDSTADLKRFIKSQEEVVKVIAENATRWHADRIRLVRSCECSRHACSNDFLDVKCVDHLGNLDICETDGRRVDYDMSIFRTPRGTNPESLSSCLKESICVYKKLEDAAKEYGRNEIGWIYIGTRDGHFRRFPGTADERRLENGDELWNSCKMYDPRIRPWYIGASTGPKDIVLIVDKSGSMVDYVGFGETTKWDLVSRAVTDMIDSFTFADYVSVVTFSDEAGTLLEDTGLIRGEQENREKLKAALQDEIPVGHTNFTAAFEVAFPLLWDGCDEEPVMCSNCEKIILFLTDGRDTSGEDRASIKPSQMAAVIERLQEKLVKKTGKRATIFTYSMSEHADDAIPRQIACASDGAWAFIGPYTNTLDALNSYYLYEASKRRTESPFWIEPYEDASGLGLVTTVAIPFYSRGTEDVPDVFLGVVGHDIILRELDFEGVTREQVFAAIFSRSKRCTLSDNTPCEVQVYRNAHDERSLCADPYPREVDAPPDADSEEPHIKCYAFREKYYKRSTEEVTWKEAVSKCEDDDGMLVSIEDREELAFLANIAWMDGSWIGAEKTPTGSFSWLNESLPNLKHDSEFWGVQEPFSRFGTENCAAIDTRGVIANLKAIPCSESATYICKFDSKSPCSAGVAEVNDDGYFKVPPLKKCVDEVEILDESLPVKDVEKLDTDDVMCDLGKERKNEELLCCEAEEDVCLKKTKDATSGTNCNPL